METINEPTPLDCNQQPINVGDAVLWTDPQTNAESLYIVYKIVNEEMICLSNPYGECEALPNDCKVIPDA